MFAIHYVTSICSDLHEHGRHGTRVSNWRQYDLLPPVAHCSFRYGCFTVTAGTAGKGIVMSKAKSSVHGSAVARHTVVEPLPPVEEAKSRFVIGEIVQVEWFNLHNFSTANVRQDSLADPLSDLVEQIRQLKEEYTTTGPDGSAIVRPEIDKDRTTTPMGLVGKLFFGWNIDRDNSLPGTIPTADEIDRCIAERRKRLDDFYTWGRQPKTAYYGDIARFVEPLWFPKGEPASPELITHDGNRRLYAMPGVAYARYVRGLDRTGSYLVPVTVRQPLTPLEEVMIRLESNLGHDQGRSELTSLDYVRIARMLKAAGGTQSDLRAFGNVGKARVGFAICELDDTFPQVNLYDRIMATPPSGEVTYVKGESYIPLSKLSWNDLQSLRSDKDYREEGTLTLREPRPTTADVIEECILTRTSGKAAQGGWSKEDSKKLKSAREYCLLLNVIGWLTENAKREGVKSFNDRFGKSLDATLVTEGFDFDKFKEEFKGVAKKK